MSKILDSILAVALVLGAGPAPAQGQTPQRAQPAATPQAEEALAFVAQLGEVMRVQVEGMKTLLAAKPLFDRMSTPEGAKAAAPRIRILMEGARATAQQANAMLAKIAPPPGLRLGTLEPATMLAEVRGQNEKVMALIADFDVFLVAAERGDRRAMVRAAPGLMEGSFLIIEGNEAMYRSRQAAIPSTQSLHQGLEIGVQLYRAMSAAGRGWFAAKIGAPAGAAATLRSQLAQVASRSRAASVEGRAQLAVELADLDRRIASSGLRGDDASTLARIRRALAGKEKFFEVGEALAAVAEAAQGGITAAGLAAEPSPQLLNRIAPLELRFHSVLAEQASIATGKAD